MTIWQWLLIAVTIISAAAVANYYILVATNKNDEHAIFMSYDNFESLYNIAPDKYTLYNWKDCGPCVRYIDSVMIYNGVFSRDLETTYYIYFHSPYEYLKARYLIRHRKTLQNDLERSKREAEFLKAAKRDLDKYNGNTVNTNIGYIKPASSSSKSKPSIANDIKLIKLALDNSGVPDVPMHYIASAIKACKHRECRNCLYFMNHVNHESTSDVKASLRMANFCTEISEYVRTHTESKGE